MEERIIVRDVKTSFKLIEEKTMRNFILNMFSVTLKLDAITKTTYTIPIMVVGVSQSAMSGWKT